MAAAAVERALAPQGPSPAVARLRLVADAASVPSDLWHGLLGPTVEVAAAPTDTGPGLASAVAAAIAGSGSELVVGALVDGGSGRAERLPPPGEGAFALLIGEVPAGEATEPGPPPASPAGAELEQLFLRARPTPPVHWVGDWTADPTAGPKPATPSSARRPARPVVSEGAYLPLPTYRAGLESRWRLTADRCGHCGATTFPVRGRCRGCGRADRLERVSLLGEVGKVGAVTWIGAGGQPTEFDEQVDLTGPYGVAFVEFPGGVVATMPLADCTHGEVPVGAEVTSSLRRLYSVEGAWRYGRKATPWRESDRRRRPG